MNIVAQVISYIFHPLFLATYLCLVLMAILPAALDPLRPEVFPNFLVLIFLITFVCPLLLMMMLRMFGYISSIHMLNRSERVIPFFFIAGLHLGMTFLFFYQFEVYWLDNLMKFLLIIDALVMVSAIGTLFYKISVHSIGIWGVVGVFLALNRLASTLHLVYALLIAILIAGMVMTARLQLNAHTPREVLVGSLLGISASYFTFLLLF